MPARLAGRESDPSSLLTSRYLVSDIRPALGCPAKVAPLGKLSIRNKDDDGGESGTDVDGGVGRGQQSKEMK